MAFNLPSAPPGSPLKPVRVKAVALQSRWSENGRDMTVASLMSVDFEQERAELESVLGSPHFVRAPKLAHLLSYLCQKLFSGNTSSVKEYSIGVEVFHRGAEFDQDSDSIVRVEANRLRKRLAEYYAGDGASHILQITIPLGQYVPEFVRTANAPEPIAATPQDLPPPISTTSLVPVQWSIRRRTAALILVSCLLILASGIAWWTKREARPPSSPAMTAAQADLAQDL